jgi:hypothetical protein
MLDWTPVHTMPKKIAAIPWKKRIWVPFPHSIFTTDLSIGNMPEKFNVFSKKGG